MRYKLLLLLFLLCVVNARTESQARVCARHLTIPTVYPLVARAARLQGVVVAKLSISPEGTVIAAKIETEDPLLIAHPLLQSETEKLVRNWTFECASCAPGGAYEQVITFNYRLQGEDSDYDNTEVSLDLPDQINVVARPPRVETSLGQKRNSH